jgi:hypothetical protein
MRIAGRTPQSFENAVHPCRLARQGARARSMLKALRVDGRPWMLSEASWGERVCVGVEPTENRLTAWTPALSTAHDFARKHHPRIRRQSSSGRGLRRHRSHESLTLSVPIQRGELAGHREASPFTPLPPSMRPAAARNAKHGSARSSHQPGDKCRSEVVARRLASASIRSSGAMGLATKGAPLSPLGRLVFS